jgi:hypothetical protein
MRAGAHADGAPERPADRVGLAPAREAFLPAEPFGAANQNLLGVAARQMEIDEPPLPQQGHVGAARPVPRT